MKVQDHINTEYAGWYRCIRVTFEGETVRWELSRTGKYDVLKAYARKPHRRLAEATDDDSLRSFVKAWGPLWINLNAWSGSDSLVFYRHQRDLFRAWIQLLDAIQNGKSLHDAAIRLLGLDPGTWAIWIRNRLGIAGELKAPLNEEALSRVARADENEIGEVCSYLVGSMPVPTPSIEIQGKGKSKILRPTIGSYSLLSALYWMLWQDIFLGNPFKFCEECNGLIDFKDKHDRKFCSPECAHRKTAREWERQNPKRGRRNDGTQKTR
jgi:hypothetical protein